MESLLTITFAANMEKTLILLSIGETEKSLIGVLKITY